MKFTDILKVKNWGFNTSTLGSSTNLGKDKTKVDQNLGNYITPVQLQRLRVDVSTWRDAIAEAERAYYPFRVKMQRVYIDTILNGHVFATLERRKDLTLLREYSICDDDGNENEDLVKFFKKRKWFSDFINYSLDSLFFGYSLISLGDIEGGKLKDVNIIPRWFISPDREQVGSFIYATSGANFEDDPYKDWHIYIKTKSDNGVTPCGYGLLYQVALYEIFLRNTLGFNGDFVELFAMPYRVGKTTKTDEYERAELEATLRDMGSAGWALIDPTDEIEFLQAPSVGTAYQAYDNLEQRCEKKISKIVLGHSDAMDSTPGKLGAESGENNPIAKSLADKQQKDGQFIEAVINEELFPRLVSLGILNIPDGYSFKFLNNKEKDEAREKLDRQNKSTAEIAKIMKDAGLQMDAGYFEEMTGIKATMIEKEDKEENDPEDLRATATVKNKLNELYNIK